MRSTQRPDSAMFARRVTATRRGALLRVLGCVLAGAMVLPIGFAHRQRIGAYLRGEIDLAGQPRYEPPHPVDRRALAEIDFAKVHGELIPAWTIALDRATSPRRARLADRAFGSLADAVRPDPNLVSLLAASHRALRDDPVEHAHRLDYWLWAYNHYLEAQRVPWRLEASLTVGEERPVFRTLTYEILADARNRSGHRLRLLRRADRTNVLEGWLGHAPRGGDHGALVLMERVLHFSASHVWPGLHPGLDSRRPPTERPWLGYVREEVRAALDSRTFELLATTAVDRQTLIEVAEAIEARRECGSRYRLGAAYNGLSRAGVGSLRRALERSEGADCPEITLEEAARVVGASERLAATRGLEGALERLAMVVARSVAVHELRHVADGEEPACPGCSPRLRGLALAEVSAYLAAFATPGAGYQAQLQACAAPRGPGVHGAVVSALLDVILPYGCEGPTRHDLHAFAGTMEHRLFGKRDRVELPALPPRVALLPRTGSGSGRPASRAQALKSGWGLAVAGRVPR